ncbi:MAG TPA: MFS transporter [Gemmatimonadales bacterium]|jgi:predicted MFS family arabinose efflux permease
MPNADHTLPPLVGRALLLYYVVAFLSMTSFYLLLSVVPLYATSVGAGRAGAGLTTGALMLTTVVTELATPALLAQYGYRLVLAAGLVLLGAPALALTVPAGLATILLVSLVRGAGLAILVVAGSSVVATLTPAERRSEGLGILGIVVGVPAVVALPLGVWLAERVGYPPVYVAAAVTSLAGLLAIPALPGRAEAAEASVSVLAGLRDPGQLRPALIFLLTAMSAGIVVTFLPLAIKDSARLAALALLANTVATVLARWWAGRYADRSSLGQPGLLVCGVVLAAVGMLALALTATHAAVATGAVLLGVGFGVAQNTSLTLMFQRVSRSGYDMVSAVWNLAYDAGLGLGAAGFGLLVTGTGYPGAFALVAGLMLVALVPLGTRSSSQSE